MRLAREREGGGGGREGGLLLFTVATLDTSSIRPLNPSISYHWLFSASSNQAMNSKGQTNKCGRCPPFERWEAIRGSLLQE